MLPKNAAVVLLVPTRPSRLPQVRTDHAEIPCSFLKRNDHLYQQHIHPPPPSQRGFGTNHKPIEKPTPAKSPLVFYTSCNFLTRPSPSIAGMGLSFLLLHLLLLLRLPRRQQIFPSRRHEMSLPSPPLA